MSGGSPVVAALATAPGPAGIAIVRMSGDGALAVADSVCAGAAELPSALGERSFRLYRLRDPRDGSLIDEALVLVFRAPRSYTGEDVAEFQIHGGRAASSRLLDALFAAGAAPAGPGEFTRRAFVNGRIPLDRAEAVMDLVGARGDRAAKAAAEQLAGAVGRGVEALRERLVALRADVEATLDFTDEEAEGLVPPEDFEERASALSADLLSLAGTARAGRMMREGALVAVSGEPNVGKSTLFNALLGTDRAIVSAEAGTTRDSLEETLVVDGIPFRLVDTAGLREAESPVEREGVERARGIAARADLVIRCVCAPANGPGSLGSLGPLGGLGGLGPLGNLGSQEGAAKRTLVLFTKADLAPDFSPPPGTLAVSALAGTGIEELRAEIARRAGADASSMPEVAVSERHAALLREAAADVDSARGLWRAGGEDAAVPAASRLRAAAEALDRITGRVWTDDLLDAVFARFCVGK